MQEKSQQKIADMQTVDIRIGYVPGCIGRIAALHASWYSANAGFGVTFESKVARELGEFCERCVDGRDGLWLATRGGTIEGSIAIDGSGVPNARLTGERSTRERERIRSVPSTSRTRH